MGTLYRSSDTGERLLNSRVAHVNARREGGPRWDPAMSAEDNRGYDNLILLCIIHASEIDDSPQHYPAELLHDWKRAQVAAHERAATAEPELTEVEVEEVMTRSFGSEEVIAALSDRMPFSPRMRSRTDALDLAVRQHEARRRRRLAPVPEDRLDAVLIWMTEQDDPMSIPSNRGDGVMPRRP